MDSAPLFTAVGYVAFMKVGFLAGLLCLSGFYLFSDEDIVCSFY